VIGDAELVALLRADAPEARALLFDRFAPRISRLVFSVLGPELEAEDVLHEVFVRALEGIHSLEVPEKLGSWLAGVAVFTAREWIRRRSRWRWLRVLREDVDAEAPRPSEEVSEALRAAFKVLAEMNADERVVFSLRFVEGMEIPEIAAVCDVSQSTVKRRLKDAQRHFATRARRHAVLLPWLERRASRERMSSEPESGESDSGIPESGVRMQEEEGSWTES
jgi:RNA polymerase sigma-70 factor (ECF subfamily)